MDNPSELLSEPESKDRLNNWIAVSVAVLAAFMAIAKVKDDNIVQAMQQAKSDAVDTWSEYQSKRIKHHLLELGRDQTIALRAIAPRAIAPRAIAPRAIAPRAVALRAVALRESAANQTSTILDSQLERYESEIARYQKEESELQQRAKGYEAQYDALNYRDDQFDLSDAATSVSIATLAVTALTKKKWLLWMSLALGVIGVVMGVAGIASLKIHPDWLTKLLS
jgi:Domain of unknown function (DUF4337)